jgi:predicted nucleotidyltransferase
MQRTQNSEDVDLAALCRRFHVRRLDRFGSAGTHRFDPDHSDLDFIVEFEVAEPAAYADAYFGLREGLISLYGRSVDLVTEASLSNPYFRTRVTAERQTVFRHPR